MLPPLFGRAERATQGGDSRWMLTHAGRAKVSVRNNDTVASRTFNGRHSGTDGLNGSGGHDAVQPVPTTESAPRRCPAVGRPNPSTTESARRRFPGVEGPKLEAAGDAADGMSGEDNEGVAADLRPPSGGIPPLQSKVGLSPTRTQCVSREVAADRIFDKLVDHLWRQHLRGLPAEVAGKRWKSGYCWNSYKDLVLTADVDHVEKRFINDNEFAEYDLDDDQRSLGG